MKQAKNNTSIAVSKGTATRLSKLGGKGDTYEDIITRLLDKLNGKGKRKG